MSRTLLIVIAEAKKYDSISLCPVTLTSNYISDFKFAMLIFKIRDFGQPYNLASLINLKSSPPQTSLSGTELYLPHQTLVLLRSTFLIGVSVVLDQVEGTAFYRAFDCPEAHMHKTLSQSK